MLPETLSAPAHTAKGTPCPNCGFTASRNFCAECGQATHLHRETFWTLITHSVAHYFHYDSKFLQTMRLLWFRPGALTLAYWRGQRARYLAPVSLYIFISAVFFLTVSVSSANLFMLGEWDLGDKPFATQLAAEQHLDSLRAKRYESLTSFFEYKGSKIRLEHPSERTGEYLQQKYLQSLPRIFFFMIPVVALLLKLLFLRRRSLLYVDHAVFSMHYQSFWFSLMFFLYLIPPLYGFLEAAYLDPMLLVLGLVTCYLALAMRKAYQTGWFRSIFSALLIQVSYICLLAFLSVVYLAVYVALA